MSTAPAAATDAAAAAAWMPPATVEDLFPVLAGNTFAGTNRPTAGARTTTPAPVGAAPIQLYSLATPNGKKVGIILEELADAVGLEYDAHVIGLSGPQFESGFVAVNPNSKIPAMVDREPVEGGEPMNVFESGSIMIYLADKYGKFIPKTVRGRTECISWVMWQMAGQGPITGGGFGHFFTYAPDTVNRDYPVARFGMEVQRLCDVLDKHLEGKRYIVGEEYTIADMICMPWFQMLRVGGYTHKLSGRTSTEFLGTAKYANLNRWADDLMARPAVARGMTVCSGGKGKPWKAE